MSGVKRKGGGGEVYDNDKDCVEIMPLGSGREVGRSCHIIKFKGKTIMLDCGVHPAEKGIAALPFTDVIDTKDVDLLLVSHFHLDHAGAVPYFLERTHFRGKCYMTHPTKSIYKLISQDYVKLASLSVEEALYDENDLLRSMDKINPIDYHEVIHHKGIKFWAIPAGHVLGAAMFMIEIAGVRILYTGDYCRTSDRHLNPAEVPKEKVDILMIEATFGLRTLEPVRQRELQLRNTVKSIVMRGGRCLLPVFSLGRAQELLLILDEMWDSTPVLQGIPVYYAGFLARKCMKVFETYINMMNRDIQMKAQSGNPFQFNHVSFLNSRGMDQFQDNGPCVVLASPGMLQSGMSRELFERWCSDKKNGVIIPGYCVEGTLAKTIMSEPPEITTMTGFKVPLKMSVHYVSFAAHADYAQTSSFIDELRPSKVILVHGEEKLMMKLKQSLTTRYKLPKKTSEDAASVALSPVTIFTPRNCQPEIFEFRGRKIAKTIGSLAARNPSDKTFISGLIVRKDFNYQLMAVEDLSKFTPLASTTVKQELTVPFNHTFKCLKYFIQQMFEVQEWKELKEMKRRAKLEARRKQLMLEAEAKEKTRQRVLKEKEMEAFAAAQDSMVSAAKAVKKQSVSSEIVSGEAARVEKIVKQDPAQESSSLKEEVQEAGSVAGEELPDEEMAQAPKPVSAAAAQIAGDSLAEDGGAEDEVEVRTPPPTNKEEAGGSEAEGDFSSTAPLTTVQLNIIPATPLAPLSFSGGFGSTEEAKEEAAAAKEAAERRLKEKMGEEPGSSKLGPESSAEGAMIVRPNVNIEEATWQSSLQELEEEEDALEEDDIFKDCPSVVVQDEIRVILDAQKDSKTKKRPSVLLRWSSNPVNDMIADSLICLIMSIEANPGAAKTMGSWGGCSHNHAKGEHSDEDENMAAEQDGKESKVAQLRWFLELQFGSDAITDVAVQTDSEELASEVLSSPLTAAAPTSSASNSTSLTPKKTSATSLLDITSPSAAIPSATRSKDRDRAGTPGNVPTTPSLASPTSPKAEDPLLGSTGAHFKVTFDMKHAYISHETFRVVCADAALRERIVQLTERFD